MAGTALFVNVGTKWPGRPRIGEPGRCDVDRALPDGSWHTAGDVDVAQQIARLRREGEALARAAESGPLDARVPGCPGWDVEALLRHVGDVHRWATTIVRERRQERLRQDFAGPDDPAGLIGWYREGHLALVDVLEAAFEDETFWHWGPAPSALAFWARRQANETAVHRCDAESARGAITPLGTGDALDGVDEWLGLLPSRRLRTAGGGRTLHLHATDGDGEWVVTLNDGVAVTRGHARADCALRGRASDLFLWSMNRQGAEPLEVLGDRGLLDVWRAGVRF